MIRILLIPSSDYLGHPFPQRHNHLFERLHNFKDIEVHVLRFNIFDRTRLKSKCIIHEIPLEFRVNRTAIYYLANIVTYTREIMRIVKRESIDAVVAGNILPPLTFQLYQRLTDKKIPFIFDLQDYYPTSAVGYIANVESATGTVMKGFFELLIQYLIKNADAVTVPGIALATYAKIVGGKNVWIIPNGVSENFFKVYCGEEIRKSLGFDGNDLVVGYIGSVEFWLDMEPLIKAVSEVHKKGIPIKLLLIGKHLQTGYPHKVERWIKRYGINKITKWLSFVPHDDVPRYIAAMNIGTIPFNVRNPTAYYAAPNKLWEYLSQGVSVVATPIPEVLLFRDLINIATSVNEYVDIMTSFEMNGEYERTTKIKQLISVRTWRRSANKFKELLLTTLAKHN